MGIVLYNIIWVDDEIDSLLDRDTKRLLKDNQIEVIGKAHNSDEFRDQMRLYNDRVDAVITDANFNRSNPTPTGDRDLSGFNNVRESIEHYNEKRDIPFYLYSGRNSFLDEKYVDEELRYFVENDRRFSKGELPEMLSKIKEDINHINSPIFRIRQKYNKELNAASLIVGNREFLENALLYEYEDTWKNTQDFFNPARKVVERIFDACKESNIIPKGVSELNAIGSLLLNGENSYFKYKENIQIMPKPLAFSLYYFLNITQDGSHGKKDVKLGIDQYIRDTKNINLFRSIVYIAMDICLWFQKAKEEYPRPDDNKNLWDLKDNIKFEYRGEIKKIGGKFVCGNYELEFDKDNSDLDSGLEIIITKSIPHKYQFTYLENETEVTVDKYVHKSNRIILK